MNLRKKIKALVFLLAILFSFSVSAYNTWEQDSGLSPDNRRGVHVDFPVKDFTTDNLLFEELENENESESDSEDLLGGSFLILPFSDSSFNSDIAGPSLHNIFPQRVSQPPIFISIRVLRI